MATAERWSAVRPPLHARTRAALRALGFTRMTPVQAASIPHILQHKDVVVEAETGSGKTLSFLVPALDQLLWSAAAAVGGGAGGGGGRSSAHPREVRVLILEPTRELARQVHEVASALFGHVGDGVVSAPALLCGGESNARKRRRVQKRGGGSGGGGGDAEGGVADAEATLATAVEWQVDADIARGTRFHVCVGTPGRVDSALSSSALDARRLEVLILDEADRLLDLGFEVTLSSILQRLAKQRRTGLYSATQTQLVDELAKAGLRDPVRIRVRVEQPAARGEGAASSELDRRIPASLRCYYHVCAPEDRLGHLLALLNALPDSKVIVYLLTCAEVDYYRKLQLERLIHARTVLALSGKVWQKKRSRILDEFRRSRSGVLFCTDVAARGLDIPDVDWVVQMNAPQDPNMYVHRVGRAARLGREGHALIFVAPEEEDYVFFLAVRKCPVVKLPAEWVQERRAEELLQAAARQARVLMLEDRAVLVRAEMAYLSHLRAYKEHLCSDILKFAKLDVASVAKGLFLIRLPKISEFKQLTKRIEYDEDPSVDYWAIAYKDPLLEKQRQESMSNREKERREKRKESRAIARSRKGRKARIEGHEFKPYELQEIEDDARCLRRLKQGRLTSQELGELGL